MTKHIHIHVGSGKTRDADKSREIIKARQLCRPLLEEVINLAQSDSPAEKKVANDAISKLREIESALRSLG
ncbi:MAG: hypothetical protein KGI08_05605 [Thaumarchaeota archaeon]|nr:hypothetical protein [Nitrososphaerota archaeon]